MTHIEACHIAMACAQIRLASHSLDAACTNNLELAEEVNKIQGQDDLENLADRLQEVIKEFVEEPVP